MKHFVILFWILLTIAPAYVVLGQGGGWEILQAGGGVESKIPVFYRLAGLYALHFLTFQITLGGLMPMYEKVFNSKKVYHFHVFNGIFTYFLALTHPLLIYTSLYLAFGLDGIWMVSTAFKSTALGPLAVFMAQVSVLLLTATLTAGFLRDRFKYWRVLHWLNYLIFFLIVIKSRILGTDTSLPIVTNMYIIYASLVVFCLLYRFVPRLQQHKIETL